MQSVENTLKNMNNPKDSLNSFFFFILFMALCFAYTANIDDSTKEINVFFININKGYLMVGICSIATLISLFKKPYLDKIFVGLLSSAVLGILPILYLQYVNHYWGNYFTLIISVMSYFIFVQSKSDVSKVLYKTMCLACTIISIQVLVTEYHYFSTISFGNISNVSIKGSMSIPIGDSNLIAAYLLPMLVFINSYKRNVFTNIVSLITVVGLIFCRSKNALSLGILIIFYLGAKKIYSFIIRDKSVSKLEKLFVLFFVTFITGSILVGVIFGISTIVKDLAFSYSSPLSNPVLNQLDLLTSGRVAVALHELDRFTNHLFLGNGYSYNFGDAKSHNWILDALVQRGIIGALIYLFCIRGVFKRSKQFYSSDKFTRAGVNLLSVIFIQGLFEITVFTPGIDFCIWSISGILIARNRYLVRHGKNITEFKNIAA